VTVSRDDLLAVIAENPGDENAWLLYADWLQQHGEPRGELIALDIALEDATDDRKRALELARANLLASYSEKLLGATFYQFMTSGYGDVAWHRGFITLLSYAGSPRLQHKRAVGWLVKLVVDNPEPFTFVKKLAFPYTDIADVTPFAPFKHLADLDVTGTNVDEDNVAAMTALRPTLRVRYSQPGT